MNEELRRILSEIFTRHGSGRPGEHAETLVKELEAEGYKIIKFRHVERPPFVFDMNDDGA